MRLAEAPLVDRTFKADTGCGQHASRVHKHAWAVRNARECPRLAGHGAERAPYTRTAGAIGVQAARLAEPFLIFRGHTVDAITMHMDVNTAFIADNDRVCVIWRVSSPAHVTNLRCVACGYR